MRDGKVSHLSSLRVEPSKGRLPLTAKEIVQKSSKSHLSNLSYICHSFPHLEYRVSHQGTRHQPQVHRISSPGTVRARHKVGTRKTCPTCSRSRTRCWNRNRQSWCSSRCRAADSLPSGPCGWSSSGGSTAQLTRSENNRAEHIKLTFVLKFDIFYWRIFSKQHPLFCQQAQGSRLDNKTAVEPFLCRIPEVLLVISKWGSSFMKTILAKYVFINSKIRFLIWNSMASCKSRIELSN